MPRLTRSLVAFAVSGLLFVPLLVPAVPSAAADGTADESPVTFEDPPEELHGEVVVRLDPAPVDRVDGEVTTAFLQRHATETQADVVRWAERTDGVSIRDTHWLVNAVTLSVDEDADLAAVADVAHVRSVADAVTVTRDPAMTSGSDRSTDGPANEPADEPSDGDSASRGDVTYGLELVGAPTAWDRYDATGEGVTVAVLDSGVAADHPDVEVDRFRAFDADGDPVDREPTDPSPQSHGTHVSGTIAGGSASGTAIGVAPDAELVVGGVLTDCGAFGCSGTFDQIIGGMEWAVAEADADVVSMSLGIDGTADAMVEPVRNARATGTLVVAAAGNGGEGRTGSPGNVHDAVGVGAVDETGSVASFSGGEAIAADDWADPPASWPDEYVVPTVVAPGVDVTSAQGSDGYGELSGTSMATPHVAGVAALVASATDADADELATALETTAAKPGDAPGPPDERDIRYGTGVVDAVAAIESLPREPVPADSSSPSVAAPMAAPAGTATVQPASTAVDDGRTLDREFRIGTVAVGVSAGETGIGVSIGDAEFAVTGTVVGTLLNPLEEASDSAMGIETTMAPGRRRLGW